MDLWRWVQACPLLHLVSRRLPGLPGFPNGLLLHDVAITRSRLRGRSEDLLFVEDPRLIQRARRGLSFVEPIGGGEATVVRRGLPKFFDIDAACLAEASCSLGAPGTMVSQATLSQSQGAASKLLADSIQQAISANAAISLTKLQKANGENVQVSYHATTGQWVLCSKNVSILASCAPELELPQWADRRYRFARQVGALWFQQLSALEEASCKSLRETLASATLIGEMVGGSGAHLVQYGPDRKLQWFAVVPHEGEEACWVPSRSHSFFQKIGLPSVEFGHHMEVYKTVESLLDALSQMVLTVEKAPLSEAGEGYVLYISAQPDTSHLDEANGSRVIHMGKLKTAEYRALRRMRDKAKQFAKSAGCLLVEDVLEDFRREATLLEEDVVETHANTLGKLCRLIFAEDLPAEEVDEKFLDLLQRAESYHGTDAPRRPAPALCLVVPPFQVDGQLAAALQALLKDRGQMKPSPPAPGGPGTQGGLERSCAELHKENLASAWYASTASKAKVYLNHIPIHVEGLFVPRDGEPAQKRRRMEMEERRNQSSSQLAQALGQRCLFILWGWSGWSTLPQLQIKQSRGQSPTESRLLRSKQLRSASGVFFQKLQAQALNLKAKLPQGQTLWLPGLPSLSDQRAMSTIATSIEQAWANTEAPNPARELQWQEASRATVVAIIPLALPGMGKSSLLEALFKRCQRGGLKCYRQGKLLDKAGALDPSFSALPIQPSSAAIVSSDGFTGEELQFMGLTAAGSSSQDVARCRRQAAHKYRKAIEDFLIAAASGVDAVHLLLLDKNHPPSSLRNEVEVLQSTCKNLGCRLFPRALAIDFVEAEASELEKQLLQEEEKHFGPWAYPWNPSVIAECGARLLLRSSHDTLAGGETSLFVLLSFLYLHKRFTLDERSVGIPVIKSPYLSTTGALASWTSDEPDSLWCRLEVRALLQQILSCLRKPFDDQQKWKPLLTSLVLHLRSQQLQVPDELLRQAHTEGCAESIWTAIFAALEQVEPPAQPQYFVPAFRYVALDVDGHHTVIESLLTKVSMAIRAITDACPDDEPFQSPEFLRPKSLHVTTCFLGSTIGDAQRKVLAASKSLVSENATFDCSITHLVAAPGALAFAVVDGSRLRGDGVPMAEEQRPHITMCTQLPWQPRHSNEVLEAVTLWLDDATVHAAGKWVRNVKVKSSVLDVFILQLERPVVLSSNPVQLC